MPECGCRALLIGVKYATNVPSEMRTMDRQAQTFRDFGRKTLLAGWLAPGTSLLSEELERAMVRVCPDLVRHRVEYANTEDMRASLTAMEACLPSYFRIHGYEIQGDSVVHVGGDGEGRAPKSDRMGRASMYSFILSTAHLTVSCIGDYKKKIHPAASVPEVALPYSQTIMPSDITSLLAHPIMTSATATEVCIPSVIASPRPLKTPMLSQSPIQGRPSLPAKLFVWHLLYTVYVRNNPSWAKMSAVTAVIAGMGFAAVLFVTDVYLPAVPLSWSWQDSSCFICSVVACGFWMMLQAAYSFMGIVDMSRRLDVSKQVAALISVDNMSIHQLGMNVLPAVVEGEGSSSDSDADNDSVVSPVGDASKLMVESPIGIDKGDAGAHTTVPVTFQQDLQAIDFRLRNFTEVDVEEVVREHDKPVAAVVRIHDTRVCECVCVTIYVHMCLFICSLCCIRITFSCGTVFDAYWRISEAPTTFGSMYMPELTHWRCCVVLQPSTTYYTVMLQMVKIFFSFVVTFIPSLFLFYYMHVCAGIIGMVLFSYALFVTAGLLAGQMMQGARYNTHMDTVALGLVRVLALSTEIQCTSMGGDANSPARTAAHELNVAVENCLLRLRAEIAAKPSRVLGFKADAPLLGSMLSGSISAIILVMPRIYAAVQQV
jgi:hypothetical protein